MIGYIYGLRHRKTGRWYVGQTVQKPGMRYSQHFKLLGEGKHHSILMQHDYWMNDQFDFEILEEIPGTDKKELQAYLSVRESDWIIKKNAVYNSDWPHVDGIQKIKYDADGKIIPYGEERSRSPKRKPLSAQISELVLSIILVALIVFVVLAL